MSRSGADADREQDDGHFGPLRVTDLSRYDHVRQRQHRPHREVESADQDTRVSPAAAMATVAASFDKVLNCAP